MPLGTTRLATNVERILRAWPGATISHRSVDAVRVTREVGDRGIVVLATPEAFEIRLPTVDLTGGAHSPVPSTRLWRRIRADRIDDPALIVVLRHAHATRGREFRPCRLCHRDMPVEHRAGSTCHACASQHRGTVY
jgi:hypothetical protein